MKTMIKKFLLLLVFIPCSIFAQGTLSGVVSDDLSGPLPGVNIKVQGTSNGTATDFDGLYSLSNLKKGDKIDFSFMGFKTFTVVYNGQKTQNITMQEDASQLEEIVVVGYGSVRKKDATGSVSTVTAKDFNKGPVISADQMLQGKVSGLQITNGGGAPGDGATIRIRSGSSISASNDPLYVIDGVPVDGSDVAGSRNPLATINQNDIESMTVLKDASATAIYGSRASNGVIIITTKKGKVGELKISYNGQFMVSQLRNKANMLSQGQFVDLVNTYGTKEQKNNLGVPVLDANGNTILEDPTDPENSLNRRTFYNTDWQDEIYRVAIGQDHNVSLTGGKDFDKANNLVYRISGGYADLSGILKRDNMTRVTLNGNLTGRFMEDKLKIEFNNSTTMINSNFSDRGAIGGAATFDPTKPVRNADKSFYQWNVALAGSNPVANIYEKENRGTNSRSIGNLQADYKFHFFPDLKIVANLGYDIQSGRSYRRSLPTFGQGYRNTTFYQQFDAQNFDERKNILADYYFNYNKEVTSIKTRIDATLGYSYQNFNNSSNVGNSYDYTYSNDTTKPNILNDLLSTNSIVNLQSVFGRANFSVMDKYLLTMSVRRDGTSRFAENNRWATFPAAALAWNLDDEKFIKNIKSISSLKLRTGWGITGQQNVGPANPSLPRYINSTQFAQYQLGSTYYNLYRPQASNVNLKWEETTTLNAGLDFGILKNRITGSVDVYQRDTKDLLLFTQNPPFFGFSSGDNYNVGTLRNKGVEISANLIAIENKNVTWNVGGNVTLQNSKITQLVGDPAVSQGFLVEGYDGGTGNSIQNNQVGYAPNSFFVYQQVYGDNGRPLEGVYVDRNNDGVINDSDKYRYKKRAADIFYGFNTSVTYKNWDLSTAWRGSWGNYVYNNIQSNLGAVASVLRPANSLSNGSANLIETGFQTADTKRLESDFYVQDGAFVRMDNLSVGYLFKDLFSGKSTAKVSLSGQNLLLITKYKGLDPEISSGVDKDLYPRPRIYSLSLNVNF